jgi:long-chain acyl-CoA synthetase
MRFLLHDSDYAGLARACASLERACSFQELDRLARLAAGDRQDLRGFVKPTDGALILFTSGTTGVPKAVVQSHYAVAQNARALAEHHRIQPEVRLLCVLPLHHVNGLEFTIFAAMIGGGHTVICRSFDLLRFWKTVREHGIHIISLVPNLLSQLADRPGLRGREPLPVRYAVSAAAPLSTAVAERVWERLGLRIVQGYGLSEVTNFSCLMPLELPAREYARWMFGGRRTCVGPCLPGQEVQIRGGEGAAPPELEGEIAIRGHCVMSGYLHNPTATEQAFRGGWFRTGDLGYYLFHPDGRAYFHISGRIREVAKRSGAMVNLLEIDEVLTSISGVADAGAAAFDNTWVGEELGALVVQERGRTLTQQAIAKECRRALPFSAVPKVIQFVDQIPRTLSGKIRRAEIAQHFAGFHDRLFTERDLKEE